MSNPATQSSTIRVGFSPCFKACNNYTQSHSYQDIHDNTYYRRNPMSCTGKPCSEVKYELASIDPPLTYTYTPVGGGQPDQGTLDEANRDYIARWLGAFLVWMGGFGLFPGLAPFRPVRTRCLDEKGRATDCECDLGPEIVVLKQYTYTPPTFDLPGGAKIKISGKFTMRVKSCAGVCTLKAGTEFSMAKRESAEFLAMLPKIGR